MEIIFDILKQVFIFNAILMHYNSDHKLIVKIDVSDYVRENSVSV